MGYVQTVGNPKEQPLGAPFAWFVPQYSVMMVQESGVVAA